MYRNLIFYAVLILFIITLNTGIMGAGLDALLGIEWSKALIEFLKTNTQGFILLLVISIYFDYLRQPTVKPVEINKDELDNILSYQMNYISVEGREEVALQRLIEKIYGEKEATSLTNYVLDKRPPYHAVVATHKLSDDPNDDTKYYWDYDLWFDSDEDDFALAVTTGAYLQDIISKSCPRINEVLTIPSITNSLIESANELFAQIQVSIISKNQSGQTTENSCSLQIVPQSAYGEYLGGLNKKLHDKLVIFYVQTGKGRKRIHFKAPSVSLDKKDHYLYWITDRILHLRKIEFDVRKFYQKGGVKFNLQPLVANFNGELPDLTKDQFFSIEVDNWVSASQGAILSWR